MALLFIDSTYDLTLGLLDDGHRWIELKTYTEKKSSAILQQETFSFCKKWGISPSELKGIISVAGPGFYTGLRLSEGFADIFKFFGVPYYSFYSFEVPAWCGHNYGSWLTKAYRGEYFLNHWKDKTSTNQLVSAEELPSALEKIENLFIPTKSALDEYALKYIKEFNSTADLLRDRPTEIFEHVVKVRAWRESFYFRAPEDEFKVSQ